MARERKNSLLRAQSGFTLIEIIIVIVLVAIIAGIAAMIILQGVRAYSDEQQRSNLHYQTRLAMERMVRETRLIRSCGDIIAPVNGSSMLQFTDINGTPITFSLLGTNLNRNGMLLANGINPLRFNFFDQNGNPTTSCLSPTGIWFIQIEMTGTQSAETIQLRARVHPMNF